jgi:ribosome-associated protein
MTSETDPNTNSMTDRVIRERDPGARGFAVASALLMGDLKCEDVVVLDLLGRSPVADCIVIGTGTSDRQMRSVLDDLRELGAEMRYPLLRSSGDERATWLVADFGTVVAHLFEPGTRAYYDLELLWGDAERVPWQRDAGRTAGRGA